MLHKTLSAKTTATDVELGQFTALVSAWGEDREGDVIERTAFDETIAAWRASGKNIPLLHEHSDRAIGLVDPHSMHADDEGLIVAGEVDRETDQGRQVWKQIKAGTIGFSIGYMSESRPRKSGGRGRILYEIDLLEISATSTPMHPSARALDWKSAPEPLAGIFSSSAFTSPGRKKQVAIDAEILETAERFERAEAKAAKRNRPIRIQSFEA